LFVNSRWVPPSGCLFVLLELATSMEITRVLEFDAGHRVWGHESKCAHVHGHRYKVEVTVTAQELDSLQRVIDFSVVKSVIGGWIDANWDHNLLLNTRDSLLEHHRKVSLFEREPFVFPDMNPTAEVMARFLGLLSIQLLEPYGITCTRCRLYETPNCWADWQAEFESQNTSPSVDAEDDLRKKSLRTMRDPRT
jgi:6-pyruvoyltetrahydropterin/6-carboxytetrahydropterin synthase